LTLVNAVIIQSFPTVSKHLNKRKYSHKTKEELSIQDYKKKKKNKKQTKRERGGKSRRKM